MELNRLMFGRRRGGICCRKKMESKKLIALLMGIVFNTSDLRRGGEALLGRRVYVV